MRGRRPEVEAVSAVLDRLGLPSSLLSPLVAHAEAVSDASPRLGLVSSGDERRVLGRHTADSLVVAMGRRPAPDEIWADLGSGGGFPGLPLAICFPRTTFALIEAAAKKAGFLEMQIMDLGLTNCRVIAQREEDSLERNFDVAVSRAVEDPEKVMMRLLSLVRNGGECVVAAASSVRGTRSVRYELPEVDSPCCLSMMAKEGDDE